MLRLEGRKAYRRAIGARVVVRALERGKPGEIHVVVDSGAWFGGSSLQAEIGLGQADSIDSIEILCPGSGMRQTLAELTIDPCYAVTEGELPAPVEVKPVNLGGGRR